MSVPASQEVRADVDMPDAILERTDIAEKTAATTKAAIPEETNKTEASANDAFEDIKEEVFDDEGFLFPSIAARIAAKKEAAGPSSPKPITTAITVRRLEDNCDALYAKMKTGYRILKKHFKVNFTSPYPYSQSPGVSLI